MSRGSGDDGIPLITQSSPGLGHHSNLSTQQLLIGGWGDKREKKTKQKSPSLSLDLWEAPRKCSNFPIAAVTDLQLFCLTIVLRLSVAL